MKFIKLSVIVIILTACVSPNLLSQSIYSKDNLFAWCIVPFDSTNRTPAERIDMLNRLGIKSYAYDWRTEHLATTVQEWTLAKENNIQVTAVWIWIDQQNDSPQKLSADNQKLFDFLKEAGLKTQVWVGFNGNFFEGLDEKSRISKGVPMLQLLHEKAADLGCTIGLYNHGDWFGEPANQVKVIKAAGFNDVGIIYNFHHAHEQLDRYTQIIDAALPYLWAVNLNGMKKEGPKILPIGSGDREKEMMTYLQKVGFEGRIGILGHVEEADVEVILKQNLAGLHAVLASMNDKDALKSFTKR